MRQVKRFRTGRVTIVRPPILGFSSALLIPPIGVAYVAAAVRRAGYPVTVIDAGEAPFTTTLTAHRRIRIYGLTVEQIVERIPRDTTCIAVSCMFSIAWPLYRELLAALGRCSNEIVLCAGGEHITALPEFSLDDCLALDYCVLNEGEETFPDLLHALASAQDPATVPGICFRAGTGEPVRSPPRSRIKDLDNIAWPAWDLVPLQNYFDQRLHWGVGHGISMPILATRGCPFQCTFCSSPQMWTTRWAARTPEDVIDEMEHYVHRFGARSFEFYDITAIIRKDWIVRFAQLLIDKKLDVAWQLPAGTRSEAIDDEVARLLARSGHRNLVYAPESGSQRVLRQIKKGVQLPRMMASFRAAIRHGLSLRMNMIVGLPGESIGDACRTILFLIRAAAIGVDDVIIAIFAPYPGSALFAQLQASGRIPRLDNTFFDSLAAVWGGESVVSYCDAIGPRGLRVYKACAYLAFYGASFAVRPWRLIQTLWRVTNGVHQTRLEKKLHAVLSARLSRLGGLRRYRT